MSKKSRRRSTFSYVYVVKCGTYYKIGTSVSPQKRLKGLQTGNPEEVILIATIPGSRRVEKSWHKTFAHKQVRGEWFDLDENDLGIIFRTSGCRMYKSEEFWKTPRLDTPARNRLLRSAKEQATKVLPPPKVQPHVSREMIRMVPCRTCNAEAGERCVDNGVPRSSNHMIRMQDAQEAHGSVIKNRLVA